MAITTTQILAGVKRRISMPASQVLLTDEDILAFTDSIVMSKVVPLMESTNQDFFVTTLDVPLVADESEYDIPYRTVGRALREIKIKSVSSPLGVRNLTKIEIEEIQFYLNNSVATGFYIKGDRIRVVPDVSASYTGDSALEIWYRLAPSQLIKMDQAATVTVITPDILLDTVDITVDLLPDTITVLTPIDFIQARSGNRVYSIDVTPIGTSTTSISFNLSDLPPDLRVGDYIALSGYAPVVTMVPNEAYPYIETATSIRCLNSISDYEGASKLQPDENSEYSALLKLIEPRVTGEPTVIMNRNGLVRGNKWGFRRLMYGL